MSTELCEEKYHLFVTRRKEWILKRSQQIKRSMIFDGWSDSGPTESEAMYQSIKEGGEQMSEKTVWDAAWLAALSLNAAIGPHSADVVAHIDSIGGGAVQAKKESDS